MIASLFIAFSTYSRIPMPRVQWSDDNRRYAMCFFPLVGAAIAPALALWLRLCDRLAIGALLRGAVGAAIPIAITGGVHMDGLMDVSDAMASWQTRERRLEILKDSHVGAFAVIACALHILLTAAGLSELSATSALPLGACFVFSRAMSALMMTLLPGARKGGMLDGFAGSADRVTVRVTCAAYILLSFAAWCSAGIVTALSMTAVAAIVTFAYVRRCTVHFGGTTGDLAGWYLQNTELWLILTLAIAGRLRSIGGIL